MIRSRSGDSRTGEKRVKNASIGAAACHSSGAWYGSATMSPTWTDGRSGGGSTARSARSTGTLPLGRGELRDLAERAAEPALGRAPAGVLLGAEHLDPRLLGPDVGRPRSLR